MAYEQRDMTGSLFRNDKKEAEGHCDYNGSALVNGTAFWLSAWINKDRNGNSYMSLKLKPKDGAKPAPSRGEPPRGYDDDDGDGIPF